MRRRRRIAVTTAVTAGLVGVAGTSMAAVPAIANTLTGTSQTSADGAADRQALLAQLAAVQAQTSTLAEQLAAASRALAGGTHTDGSSGGGAPAGGSSGGGAPAGGSSGGSSANGGQAPSTPRPSTSSHPGAQATGSSSRAPHTLPTVAPTPHTTTGASGSAGGGGGDDGGGDDGGGHDSGGGGDD